jgi:hypothetical protein
MLNVHGFIYVRQTEIHTTDTLVTEPNASEIEMATEELKSHKSPGIHQITAKLIRTGGKTICSKIYKFIISL